MMRVMGHLIGVILDIRTWSFVNFRLTLEIWDWTTGQKITVGVVSRFICI